MPKQKRGPAPNGQTKTDPSPPWAKSIAEVFREINEAWANTVLVDKNGKPFNTLPPDKDRIVGSFLGPAKPAPKEDDVSDEEFNKLCGELGITPEDAIRFTQTHRNE